VIEKERLRGLDEAVKDVQTVTSAGDRVQETIDGVEIRRARTHIDHRGDLCEIYDERWPFLADPARYAYLVTLRPGAVRGWGVHLEQEDRLFFAFGAIKVALYDGREDSATVGRVNVLYFGERDRALVRIPPGVFHALKNVGHVDAVFVNLPSRPYEHDNPDKLRVAIDSESIPYRM
jgi:dTDP-4-dehydrorhamnose 3,5-epimerase